MDQILSFRPEQPADEAFLLQLYASTRAAEMQLVPWDNAQKEAFLRSQFALQTHHYRKYYAEASFLIVQMDGQDIGRLYVHRSERCLLVIDIALMPAYRGAGIGGQLIRNVLSEAAAAGKSVQIHVERNNPALRLYQRLRFRVLEDLGVYFLMEWSPDAGASA
ncbi:MAG TPA: GNAT family N-acetyltransferase [Candidatus Acidoferrum sp.]|nr:GNAT family N-acetyltransferase [Candidatus Acidoferrum sp.]